MLGLLVALLHICATTTTGPLKLHSLNWKKIKSEEWLVKFYSNRCGACVHFQSEWRKLIETAHELNITVGFAEVDVDKELELSVRFLIQALPTIVFASHGKFYRYLGPREHAKILNFLNLRKSEDVKEMSKYMAPDSFLISLLAKMSILGLRIHEYYMVLIKDSKYPAWLIVSVAILFCIGAATLTIILIVQFLDLLYSWIFRKSVPRSKTTPTLISKADGDDKSQGHLKNA
ncbi:Thioredoxin-related transmembrane protein 1 [Thelohanellus kitauei]|uniref:Thioredoxin-related transmembrane protein 1 n=1 Tax=Thelohanellus kitauei TaxID=669202 RepID=A0A0C2IG44_THEKT|nr:Thioredoxin-related transmembrane protein 1 [Thelohanellus kitauei]